MDGTAAFWLPDSPRRRPAWRWLRAEWLQRRDERSDPRLDDDGVARAGRVLAEHGQPDSAVREALDLWRADDPQPRWHLEARLLTPEPLDEVAHRCALTPDVVAAYHHLCFAVRDRPAARDWIMIKAVGCGPWNEFAGPQPGGLWKYTAATGGALLLDVTIAVTTGAPLPDSVRAACARSPTWNEHRLRLTGKLTFALMTARSSEEVRSLIALHDQLQSALGTEVGDREDGLPTVRLMESFLKGLGRRASSRQETMPATTSQGSTGAAVLGNTRQRRRGAVAAIPVH